MVCSPCCWPLTVCCHLFGLLQPCLRAGRSRAAGDLGLCAGARRGTEFSSRRTRRTTAGIAIGLGQSLCRHGRWAPDRARPEDRQAGMGQQAAGFQEDDRSASPARRCGVQGHGDHWRPGRRMAPSRTDLRAWTAETGQEEEGASSLGRNSRRGKGKKGRCGLADRRRRRLDARNL